MFSLPHYSACGQGGEGRVEKHGLWSEVRVKLNDAREVPALSLAECPTIGSSDVSPLLGPLQFSEHNGPFQDRIPNVSPACWIRAGPEHRGRTPSWTGGVHGKKADQASWGASRSEELHAVYSQDIKFLRIT